MTETELTKYRLEQIEKELPNKASAVELNRIAGELRSLRKTLIGFMVSVAGSSILFSFTVLELVSHSH